MKKIKEKKIGSKDIDLPCKKVYTLLIIRLELNRFLTRHSYLVFPYTNASPLIHTQDANQFLCNLSPTRQALYDLHIREVSEEEEGEEMKEGRKKFIK